VQVQGGAVFMAPVDIVLTDFDVAQPDVVLFSPERVHLLDLRKVTRFAPDLAIEILSPGTAHNDRRRKLQLFEQHRLREYWLVDADRPSIEVYRLAGKRLGLAATADGGQSITSNVLPELALRPSDLLPASSH
jgi:Uma2 family endonuclease